jgi:transcriptional regulator with GAF, ATPase, and Fis domain
MGYRYQNAYERRLATDPRFMEMEIMHQQLKDRQSTVQIVMLDGDKDTVEFAREQMNAIVANVIKVKNMETKTLKKVDENARLFERNLEPWFSLISQTVKGGHLLDKLSSSLKKALILMAMERYHCNRESVARVLGLSPERLEKEMALCGLGSSRHSL